jgi:glutamine amidotransferase
VSAVVALVDYGAGNLASVRKALQACGAEVLSPAGPRDLSRARAVVVPGVGHFGATRSLDEAWRREIRARLAEGAALLGICLGLQWLFEGSEEDPESPGLAVLSGRCSMLRPAAEGEGPLKVPHVGWNDLELTRPSVLLRGIPPGSQAYFTHSYAAPVTADCVATTTHGRPFASAVERGRVFGAQFHPEKSGDVGLRVLRNFLLSIE